MSNQQVPSYAVTLVISGELHGPGWPFGRTWACPQCGGDGQVPVCDEDWQGMDACYHCGTSGRVSYDPDAEQREFLAIERSRMALRPHRACVECGAVHPVLEHRTVRSGYWGGESFRDEYVTDVWEGITVGGGFWDGEDDERPAPRLVCRACRARAAEATRLADAARRAAQPGPFPITASWPAWAASGVAGGGDDFDMMDPFANG